jgi:hypothetical protein
MAAAVVGVDKTLRLQLAEVVAAAVTRRVRQQVLRLAATADSPLRRGRALTFRALPGRLVPGTLTTVISAAAVGAARQMLLLQPRAAAHFLVVALVDRVAERLLSPL